MDLVDECPQQEVRVKEVESTSLCMGGGAGEEVKFLWKQDAAASQCAVERREPGEGGAGICVGLGLEPLRSRLQYAALGGLVPPFPESTVFSE